MTKWAQESKQYRRFVATLDADALDNERYTVDQEWRFAESDFARRYPHLERADFRAILGLPHESEATVDWNFAK